MPSRLRLPLDTDLDLALGEALSRTPSTPSVRTPSTEGAESTRTAEQADDTPLWPAPCPPYTYLAGTAGSGKTFAVQAWAERERGLELCATTGISAINLSGTTINATLGYFDTASLQ